MAFSRDENHKVIMIDAKFMHKIKICCRKDKRDIAFSIGIEEINGNHVQVCVIVNQDDQFCRKEAWRYLVDRMECAKTLLSYCKDWEQVVIERPQLDYWWLHVSQLSEYTVNSKGARKSNTN